MGWLVLAAASGLTAFVATARAPDNPPPAAERGELGGAVLGGAHDHAVPRRGAGRHEVTRAPTFQNGTQQAYSGKGQERGDRSGEQGARYDIAESPTGQCRWQR